MKKNRCFLISGKYKLIYRDFMQFDLSICVAPFFSKKLIGNHIGAKFSHPMERILIENVYEFKNEKEYNVFGGYSFTDESSTSVADFLKEHGAGK